MHPRNKRRVYGVCRIECRRPGIPDRAGSQGQGTNSVKIADTSGQDVVLDKSAGKRRLLMSLAAAVVGIVLVGWWVVPSIARWSSATATVSAERLRFATVERGNLVRDVAIQGRVVAAVSPTLYASDAGTITLEVVAGAAVIEGQVLAMVDSPELTSQLEQAESSLAQQQVELDRQRIESRQQALEKRKEADLALVTLEAAQREKRRADEARAVQVISVIDFEKAGDDLRNAELAHQHAVADADLFNERLAFEIRASELAVDRQKLLVQDFRRQVDALAIRSPVNGIVGDLLVEQKAAVGRDTPVMAVVDLSNFQIEALVPESYADDLALGMVAEVSVGNDRFAGELIAVSPEIVSNQVSTRIRFAGRSPDRLRQNQRLSTRILLEERPDVLTLRRGQFLDSGGGRVAYVLTDDGLAERRSIELGARSLASVEVVGGLQEGDQVVISSVDIFRGADRVLIAN